MFQMNIQTFGQDYNVALLSKLYLTVSAIIIPSLKSDFLVMTIKELRLLKGTQLLMELYCKV